MTLTLFEIAHQFKEFELLCTSEELPDELVRDTLESIEADFDTKAVAVAKMALSLKAHAESIAEAAKAMAARADRVLKRSESLKSYLLLQMQVVQRQKIETPELIIRRQNNPPTVVVTDEAAVPQAYWYQPPIPAKQISKKLLLKALQDGERIEGCFAEQGEHVRIVL